jgi:hypothetical protein
MKITELKWQRSHGGALWTLCEVIRRPRQPEMTMTRKLFDVMYMGRTQVAFGGGRMRWKIQDRRYWVVNPEDIPEFAHVHEAKAWVDAVVRLET